MPQIYDVGPTALLPLRREACWEFFRPNNPTASAGFEPAIHTHTHTHTQNISVNVWALGLNFAQLIQNDNSSLLSKLLDTKESHKTRHNGLFDWFCTNFNVGKTYECDSRRYKVRNILCKDRHTWGEGTEKKSTTDLLQNRRAIYNVNNYLLQNATPKALFSWYLQGCW